MKLIIAGSRTFTNYALVEKTIAEMNIEITEYCGIGHFVPYNIWQAMNEFIVEYCNA